MNTAYLTSFCNFYHRIRDGKPIEHECFILIPASLQLEIEGRYDEIEKIHNNQTMRRGVRK